jgi:hypothetical protein
MSSAAITPAMMMMILAVTMKFDDMDCFMDRN